VYVTPRNYRAAEAFVDDVESRIAQAALNKQKESLNKRLKANDSRSENTEASSSYLKLVGELQKAEGNKDSDSSKWNVR